MDLGFRAEDADAEEDLAGRATVTPRRARRPSWRFSFMVCYSLGEVSKWLNAAEQSLRIINTVQCTLWCTFDRI